MPINRWPWTKPTAPTATNSKEPIPGHTAVPVTAVGLFNGSADASDAARVAPAMTAHPTERSVRSLIRLPSFVSKRYEQPSVGRWSHRFKRRRFHSAFAGLIGRNAAISRSEATSRHFPHLPPTRGEALGD